jgi:hypothetical protein
VSCLPSLLHPAAGLFAQASFSTNLDDFTSVVQSAGRRTRMDFKDELTLIGSIVLIAGLVFFLTAVFRKRHHHRDRRDYAPPSPARPRENAVVENGKIRRRRRRRDHRPRNPTRAEAGGLPPRREGEEDLPPA